MHTNLFYLVLRLVNVHKLIIKLQKKNANFHFVELTYKSNRVNNKKRKANNNEKKKIFSILVHAHDHTLRQI